MANWWKYGLCGFIGLGVGILIGSKATKDRCEEEYEQKIEDIRDIYRNNKKASKPSKKKEEPEKDKPEVTTKTSIQMEKLSEKKNRADEAAGRYSKAFQDPEKPEKPKLEEEPDDEVEQNWSDFIHVVDELPEDSDYHPELLKYYADGIVAYAVNGQKMTDEEIRERIGEDSLKLLDNDDCNEIFVRNDLYRIDYTIIFQYDEWAKVVEEEPYKAEQ